MSHLCALLRNWSKIPHKISGYFIRLPTFNSEIVKAIPMLAWTDLWGFQEFEAPTFHENRLCSGGNVVSPTYRPPLLPRNISFICQKLLRAVMHINMASKQEGGRNPAVFGSSGLLHCVDWCKQLRTFRSIAMTSSSGLSNSGIIVFQCRRILHQYFCGLSRSRAEHSLWRYGKMAR